MCVLIRTPRFIVRARGPTCYVSLHPSLFLHVNAACRYTTRTALQRGSKMVEGGTTAYSDAHLDRMARNNQCRYWQYGLRQRAPDLHRLMGHQARTRARILHSIISRQAAFSDHGQNACLLLSGHPENGAPELINCPTASTNASHTKPKC